MHHSQSGLVGPHVQGTPGWNVSTKTPLFSPGGSVIGLTGVMYPIATHTILRMSPTE